MKRGKDDEGSIGPMFPRLHVNDTAEKGGPRAPPRNKMALYEQLSIPSQRFGASGVSPLNSQASVVERQLPFPHNLHQSSPKQQSNGPDEGPIAMVQRKKLGDEHEFTVPLLLKSRVVQSHDTDSVSSISSALSGGPTDAVVVTKNNNVALRDTLRNESPKNAAPAQDRSRGHDLPDFEACLDRKRESGLGDKVRSEPHCVEDRSRHNHIHSHNSVSVRVEKGCGVSEEALMLESISGLDIAPDDVVGIIGQKHFWKARKAILNQQRVFSVQLFELHRLIKVQKLIAQSPHLLLEDGAFLGQSANKSPQKISLNPLPSNDSEKPSHHKRTEFSAENLFRELPLSSMNPPPVITTASNNCNSNGNSNNNNKPDPWCFHQPPGPQWLVPVMSPSEGLVYKPYPGPGLPGSVYGPPPFGDSFGNSPYGVQSPHHHHPVSTPPASPAYFPHYGVAYPNPDSRQMNQFSQSQTSPAAGAGAPRASLSLNTEQQSSCNDPKPPRTSGSHKFKGSRGSDLQQGSTASSPAERRDPLPLFPVGPSASEEGSGSQAADQQPTRAIRVVPHSRRSATESAARIFRFIQEERKQVNYS